MKYLYNFDQESAVGNFYSAPMPINQPIFITTKKKIPNKIFKKEQIVKKKNKK